MCSAFLWTSDDRSIEVLEKSLKNLSDHAKTILTLDGVILGILVFKSPTPHSIPQTSIFAFALAMLLVSIFCCIGTINTGIFRAGNSELPSSNWRKKLEIRENNALRWYATVLDLLLFSALALSVFELIIIVQPKDQIWIVGLGILVFLLLIWWSRDILLNWWEYIWENKSSLEDASESDCDKFMREISRRFYPLSLIFTYKLFSQFGINKTIDQDAELQTVADDAVG